MRRPPANRAVVGHPPAEPAIGGPPTAAPTSPVDPASAVPIVRERGTSESITEMPLPPSTHRPRRRDALAALNPPTAPTRDRRAPPASWGHRPAHPAEPPTVGGSVVAPAVVGEVPGEPT